MDQEKEANPIAEIFDEMFTLMEDLETRSAAVLVFEHGDDQGDAVAALCRAAGFTDVSRHRDLAGRDRAVRARR